MEIQWSLVLFTTFVGLGCWCFVGVAIDTFLGKAKEATMVASITSIAVLIIGGLSSVTHLSHPTRMTEALSVPTSSIFVEAAGVFILMAIVAVFLVLYVRKTSEIACKVFAVAGLVVAIVLSFSVGNSYIMVARPAWNTITLPLAYVGTAAVLGMVSYALICAIKKTEGAKFYAKIAAVLGAVSLITVLLYAVCSGTIANADAALLLWGGAVIIGAIGPAVLSYLTIKKPENTKNMLIAATACAIIGCVCFRSFMWVVGSMPTNYFGLLG